MKKFLKRLIIMALALVIGASSFKPVHHFGIFYISTTDFFSIAPKTKSDGK